LVVTISREPELELLVRIAHTVESRVAQERMSPHPFRVVAVSAGGTPTEEADRVAEAQVLSFLEQEGLNWDLLSEEMGYVRRGGEKVLILDPIDGSSNLLSGLPFATISLALGNKSLSDVKVGVVHDLYSGKTYWATKGGGAFQDGVPIKTRPWRQGRDLFFLNLNRNSTDRLRSLTSKAARIRSLGCASMEMSLVASGVGDLYFSEAANEGSNLRITDIAAAQLILTEAGGGFSKGDGSPLEMTLSIDERTSILAWGSRALMEEGKHQGYW
jgi:fructose-1,6-bisphosphatase/inositol monophosphatase family enzyme